MAMFPYLRNKRTREGKKYDVEIKDFSERKEPTVAAGQHHHLNLQPSDQ